MEDIIIQGAREHNLKNISLRLPREKFIVITGPSGSGKSTLAFDTIYAEGHRRYVESLSTYARQFLERVDKPEVDYIEGISPAIAIGQQNPVKHSRSTVGTATEIYDYLRLLYSKVGRTVCPDCKLEVKPSNVQETAQELLRSHPEARAFILFPLQLEEGDSLGEALSELVARGFLRIMAGGEVREIEGGLAEELLSEAEGDPGRLELHGVVDRLRFREEVHSRLADSLETAFEEGGGVAAASIVDGPFLRFSRRLECTGCGRAFEAPTPLFFSFNNPQGACPECGGFGNKLGYDLDLIVPDKNKSLAQGAIEPWTKPRWRRHFAQELQALAREKKVDLRKPFKDLTSRELRWVLHGTDSFMGVYPFFEYMKRKKYKLAIRVFTRRYMSTVDCERCHGARLRADALNVKVGGLNIAELSALSVRESLHFIRSLPLTPFERDVSRDILNQVESRLAFLEYVGVDYLTLNRLTRTLSGGEAQRINLANQLGAQLTGTLYILDEPTVGLHPRDTAKLLDILHSLCRRGNTLIVVEHDRDVISSADHIVDLGPMAGEKGGEVVYAGPLEGLLEYEGSLTAQYLRGDRQVVPKAEGPPRRRGGSGHRLSLLGAGENNLKGIDLHIPLGTFTCITGVSGSGKSTLIHDTLFRALDRIFHRGQARIGRFKQIQGFERLRDVVLLDQNPIGKSPRSNPVSYIKAYDPIRRLFAETPEARERGYGPGHFSFNVAGGRCESCAGSGYQKIEMHFMADLYIRCPDCEGRRFTERTLEVLYKGLNIDQVLNLTVEEAMRFFADCPGALERLRLLQEVGLGYLRLGQPATTLSGGEAQRLKIAAQIGSKAPRDILYLLDEPTTGLHFHDIERLLKVLGRLVDIGNTVVVIEHNLDVIRAADHIIDLGPEGGDRGGEIVAEGTPEWILSNPASYTGRFLKAYLESAPAPAARAL